MVNMNNASIDDSFSIYLEKNTSTGRTNMFNLKDRNWHQLEAGQFHNFLDDFEQEMYGGEKILDTELSTIVMVPYKIEKKKANAKTNAIITPYTVLDNRVNKSIVSPEEIAKLFDNDADRVEFKGLIEKFNLLKYPVGNMEDFKKKGDNGFVQFHKAIIAAFELDMSPTQWLK